MRACGTFTLYHSPGSRSGRTKMMLDLLELPYDLELVDTRTGAHKEPAYLRVNPYGVVPTLVHDGRTILESGAQVMYLADLVPDRGLAPPLGSPLRAAYLELFVLSASVVEREVVSAWRRPDDPGSKRIVHDALGLYEDRLVGPYFLGDDLSAADVFLHWSLRFFASSDLASFPLLWSYADRMSARLDWTEY